MKNQVRVLIVGAGDFPIYEKAFYDAFVQLGYNNSVLVTWKDFFPEDTYFLKNLRRLELHYAVGLMTTTFNNKLVSICTEYRPEIVFLYSCRLVYRKTVEKIKKTGAHIVSYCNDDPFSEWYSKLFWRHYINSLGQCDMNYVYRYGNIQNVKQVTGREGKLLRSYYIENQNFPCKEEDIIKETPDVIFLGHSEDDERFEYIDALLKLGIKVGLNQLAFGKWGNKRENIIFLENPRSWYNRYICSCKIPLVFLSKINRDTYTRRCFEIPAAKAFLFCPYTDDLAGMFEEDKEIVFYRTKEEFIYKIKYYLEHDEERKRIASAGYERVKRDGHEVKSRVMQVMDDYLDVEV